jgi:hypothetical protein
MNAHASTTQARVGGRGRMKRRIVPGGILALSLTAVLMAGTASTASAERVLGTWTCPPPSTPPTTLEQIPEDCFSVPSAATPSDPGSFDFGYDRIGTRTSQRFGLGVSGETFNPRIGVSGDYAQTNNCPPTLSAGAPQTDGCLITVTFTPTGESKGPRPGTLTTGPGGPTMALTGNGEPRDSVPPDLQLSGPKKQDPQDQDEYPGCDGHHCDVKIKVSCGDEWCTARAKGRLTNVKLDKLRSSGPAEIAPGETSKGSGPELRKDSQRKQVRKALAEGKNVQAKVTVRATDAAGNVATAKRTIKLVKSTKQGFKRLFDAVKRNDPGTSGPVS